MTRKTRKEGNSVGCRSWIIYFLEFPEKAVPMKQVSPPGMKKPHPLPLS
jgi:hypothetical protein